MEFQLDEGKHEKKTCTEVSERFEVLKLGLRYSGHLSSKWVCFRSPICENNCGHVEDIWWFLHPYFFGFDFFVCS